MLPTLKRANKCASYNSRGVRLYAAPARAQQKIALKTFKEKQRIRRDKAEFVPPQDSEALYLYFPATRLGSHPEINYEMSFYGVSPCGENAYRNLHLRHLMMKAPGKVDAEKALHFEGTTTKNHVHYFSESPHSSYDLSRKVPSTSIDDFRKLLGNVSRHLSTETNDLYLCDGSLGSHRLAQANVRLITSDPRAALYLNHMLNPTAVPVDEFKQNIYVLHAPNYVPENPELFGFKTQNSFTSMMIFNGETALDNSHKKLLARIPEADKQLLVGAETGLIIIGGTASVTELREALTTMGDYVHLRQGATPLDASTLTLATNSSLVFDPEGILVSKGVNPDLFSVQHSVYKNGNLYRYFNGASHNNLKAKRKYGDIVEKFGETGQVTTKVETKELYRSGPGSVVFVVKESATAGIPTLTKLSNPSLSAGLFSLNSNSRNRLSILPKPDSLSSAFDALLKTSKAEVFILNSTTAGNAFEAILKAVVSGSASSAPVTPVPGTKLGGIDKLEGISPKTLNPGAPNQALIQAFAKKLGLSE